jgi:hypothetical protein
MSPAFTARSAVPRIEIDEQHVETAKARWEKLTSKKAEKIEINSV